MTKKTVIVVGAGASCEYNLPTSNKLKSEIGSLLDIRFEHGFRQDYGDHLICEALRSAIKRIDSTARDINPHLHTAWQIRDAMPQAISIDNFIDAHYTNDALVLCGKLAIARAILLAEKNSSLYFDPRHKNTIKFSALESNWLNLFMQLLTENCRIDKIQERLSQVVFVIFNYDRCIEHYLFHALRVYYGIEQIIAARYVKNIIIYHPYGQVGTLPFYNEENPIAFGQEPTANQLLACSDEIKTFTEETKPTTKQVQEINKYVSEAEKVIFLGFAYHRQNMELLFPQKFNYTKYSDVSYFGTAHGISDSDCTLIRNELNELAKPRGCNLFISNKNKCADLFRENWRRLSLY